MIPISVVVPARDAEGMLDTCLASIVANRPAEIIVVDGMSRDRTVQIALEHGARVISDEGKGLPAARALGAAAATSPTIAFIDADVVLHDGALAALDEERRQDGLAALQAGLRSEGGRDYWSRALAAHHRMGRSRTWFGVSATVADRATMLEHGFDARFRSGEDIDLRWRLRDRGVRVGVSTRCVVRHRFGEGFSFARNQWAEDGRGLAQMAMTHGLSAVRLLALPAAAAARGAAVSLLRLQPQWLPYFVVFFFFNYVAMIRHLTGQAGRSLREPREDGADAALSLMGNSVALSAARVGTMAIGVASWLVAARLFDLTTVGIAAAVVAATMLCVQLAQLGVGTAILLELPASPEERRRRLEGAVGILLVSASVVPVVFLAVAAVALDELALTTADPAFALIFIGLSFVATFSFFLDHVSVALRTTHQALFRNAVASLLTLTLLAGVGVIAGGGARTIVTAWLIGATVGAVIGLRQLGRALGSPVLRPRWVHAQSGRLLRIGMANHVLALVERAPGLLLPVVVVEALSPADNAVWYATWMMAWAAYFVPQSTGIALLAEASQRPGEAREAISKAMRSSLLIGCIVAGALGLLGPLLLRLLGPSYSAGTVPLFILLAAVIPAVYIQTYFAVCRNSGRLKEAIGTGAFGGLLAVAGAIVVSDRTGLIGTASAWLIAQSAMGAWAAVRIRTIQTSGRALATPFAADRTGGASVSDSVRSS